METETPGSSEAPAMGEEALQAKVQETLESLLSKKNLVRDQFLAGNMNPQMYIPIRVLMAHEKMSAVGATEETIARAATASTRLGIDDAKSMVRPLLKSKRNVIILRDMPDNTTEEDVAELFKSGPHAEKLVNIKAEVNNTWFVKFNLDEGTQDVVLWLRSQQCKGKPVNASIKSEHFLRSFFPLHMPNSGPEQGGMGYPMDGGMGFPMGYGPMGGPTEMLVEGIGPMGFDFNDAMKGKGKGMMPMMMPEMPPGPQPPGSWQPWGKRHQPPPMILPLKYPEPSSQGAEKGSGGQAEKGDKGKAKGGKGAGSEEKWGNEKWGNQSWGNGWNNNSNWGSGKSSWSKGYGKSS